MTDPPVIASEAKQSLTHCLLGLLRRFAPRNDFVPRDPLCGLSISLDPSKDARQAKAKQKAHGEETDHHPAWRHAHQAQRRREPGQQVIRHRDRYPPTLQA